VSTLVLDIETVRDERVWSPPADNPDAFAPPYAWRPIVVGCVLLEQTSAFVRTVRVGALEAEPELDLARRELGVLKRFAEFVAERRPAVVTWNGRGFDLPVLMLRSMRAGLPASWYYGNRDARYRFTEDGHCDLADVMSDYGATPRLSLDGMAKTIGLPGKFGDIDGAGVAEAFAGGRLQDIGSYCMADAAQTAFLWLRWLHLTGRMPVEAYRLSAQDLLWACEKTGRLGELVGRVDRRVLLLEQDAA
jgi:3'-5' exonuclease